MKALFSLVLTPLLLQLSAFSAKEATPPKAQQQMLLGTWKLAKYVHKARSSAGTFFRNDSTIIPQRSNTYLVTFNADGTIERPSDTGEKETYAYKSPPNKLRVAYRKEQSGIILYDDFFYVRSATPYNL
jgi:hypothetical protein